MSESRVIQVNIEDHMKSAYIDYSMSVIVSRALPDVRDGLKPVHRRVLFGMNEMGMSYNKAHKKAGCIYSFLYPFGAKCKKPKVKS